MSGLDQGHQRYRLGLKMGPSAHCRGNLRFGFLRLSTIKKWPDTLKSDHRGLRNSKEKFMWVVGGWVGGGCTNDYLENLISL